MPPHAQRATFAEPAGCQPADRRPRAAWPAAGSDDVHMGGAKEWGVSTLLLKAALHEQYEKKDNEREIESSKMRAEVQREKDKRKALSNKAMARFQAMEDELEACRRREEQYKLTIADLKRKVQDLEDPTGEIRRREVAKKRALMRFLHRSLAVCVDTWRGNTEEQRENRRKVQRVVSRMRNGSIVRCFELWSRNVEDGKQMKATAGKVVRRMLHGALTRCFHRWLDSVAELWELRAKARKVVARMMNGCLVETFEVWIDFVVDVKESREQNTRRVLGRLKNAVASRAFDFWAEQVAALRKMRRIVARVRNSSLVLCSQAWPHTLIGLRPYMPKNVHWDARGTCNYRPTACTFAGRRHVHLQAEGMYIYRPKVFSQV